MKDEDRLIGFMLKKYPLDDFDTFNPKVREEILSIPLLEQLRLEYWYWIGELPDVYCCYPYV